MDVDPLETDDDGRLKVDVDGPLVERASADMNYMMLRCPVRDGERRASFLCATTCARKRWSDGKADRVRSRCASWERFLEVSGST